MLRVDQSGLRVILAGNFANGARSGIMLSLRARSFNLGRMSMTTQRLYYHDAYQTEFTATITAVTRVADQVALQLDASYFYPTSGGQAHDLGQLGDQAVIDVQAGEDGAVLHVLAAQTTELVAGQAIHGQIDWPRRYDHMQQHSGQHLLSQLVYQQFGWETTAVHFGENESTLDLTVESITPSQLAEIEREASTLIYAGLPITAYLVGDAELATIPLRRPPKVRGQIRIVEIASFDYSACGGTHVRTTAEIGPLKLTRQERRRGQTRLSFLCGWRALRDYAHKHALLQTMAQQTSTDFAELPQVLDRQLMQIKTLHQQVSHLTRHLVQFEAVDLLQQAAQIAAVRVITQRWADRTVDELRGLAAHLQQQPQVVLCLATTAGDKVTLLLARSGDLDLHMGNLLRDLLQTVGGKGGGRPDFAQGGVADPALAAQLLAQAAQTIQNALNPT